MEKLNTFLKLRKFANNLTENERYHLSQAIREYLAKLKCQDDLYELLDSIVTMFDETY